MLPKGRPHVGDLILDIDRLYYHEKFVRLDSQQQLVMRVFLDNPGKLITYERLQNVMHGGVREADWPNRPRALLAVKIGMIKKGLKILGIPKTVFENIYGAGYVFNRDGIV